MDSELIKWLAQMPKNYELSGTKIEKAIEFKVGLMKHLNKSI